MRLAGKVAIIVGAGQSLGEGMGNGRATALLFTEEGAKVLAIDNRLASAEDTAAMAAKTGGGCVAYQADVTKEATLVEAIKAAHRRWGGVDILHNNVGVSIAGRRRSAARDHRGSLRSPDRDQSARNRHGL